MNASHESVKTTFKPVVTTRGDTPRPSEQHRRDRQFRVDHAIRHCPISRSMRPLDSLGVSPQVPQDCRPASSVREVAMDAQAEFHPCGGDSPANNGERRRAGAKAKLNFM